MKTQEKQMKIKEMKTRNEHKRIEIKKCIDLINCKQQIVVFSIQFLYLLESKFFTTNPVSPFFTTSPIEVFLKHTTGVPQSKDSAKDFGQPSSIAGAKYKSPLE